MGNFSYLDIELTYIVPVYLENASCNALNNLITTYEKYDKEILKRVYFIFVDDCSPINITIVSDKLNYQLVRIEDDIPWNQGGARNLGVTLSKSSKLILTDLDHIFSEETLHYLLGISNPRKIYKFRRKKDGKKINSHVNTFFCTKSIFYKSLGVDEEFCGFYGFEDVHFIELQRKAGTRVGKIRRFYVELVEHKDNEDKGHHKLVRNSSRNLELLQKKKELLKTGNIFKAHSRIHLNFQWKKISENELGK